MQYPLQTLTLLLWISSPLPSLLATGLKRKRATDNHYNTHTPKKRKTNAPTDLCLYLPLKQQQVLLLGYCHTSSKHHTPKDIVSVIFQQVYSLPKHCKNANYAGRDLTGYDLTNRDFTNANLTQANLTGAIFDNTILTNTHLKLTNLTNTQCRYLRSFNNNIEKNTSLYDDLYQRTLAQDIQSIEQTYPLVHNPQDKANLLYIAFALAYSPLYERIAFAVKVQYWFCKLFLLKQSLNKALANQLQCSLEPEIEFQGRAYCWQTDYKEAGTIKADVDHEGEPNFDAYIQAFQNGLKQYNVKSKYKCGYDYYKEKIELNIQGLKKAYPKLKDKKLQKEAVEIADMLSKSYQTRHLLLLFHYLSLQNRLI